MEEITEEKPLPPYKILDAECAQALKDSRRIVEGTEFAGLSRADMRRRGVRSYDRPEPRPAPKHWLRVRKEQIVQQRLELATGTEAEAQVKPNHANPLESLERWDNYQAQTGGIIPTAAQERRLKKKNNRALAKRSEANLELPTNSDA